MSDEVTIQESQKRPRENDEDIEPIVFAIGFVMIVGKYYIKKMERTTSFAEDNEWKWFEDVVGALDGTHIKMIVPVKDRPRYRDRKGDISTNVLATCDLELRFTYVLPGWEGSASDPRVLRDALRRPNGLRIPRRKKMEETSLMQEVEQDLLNMEAIDVTEEEDYIFDKRFNGVVAAMNSKRHGKEPMGPPRRRGYVLWNSQMDAILTSTLLEQINKGNKGDGDFKTQAYQDVVDRLRTELSTIVTVDQVMNRIKVWKKHYAVISEIRTYTKFKWDEERKMVVIPVEDLSAWKLYCQV
ncbi:putative nuclease HARBI1 [Bienertia sinuspersici]